MTKQERYLELVQKRKKFKFSEGLLNPAEIYGGMYDCDHVEPWARWQANLDAEVFLIGQDFGGSKFFRDKCGDNDPDSQTNNNLMLLFKQLGIDLGHSNSPNPDASVFLTNAIVGIIAADGKAETKEKIKGQWLEESAKEFIKPLLDIVQPRIIIAMSEIAFRCLAHIYPYDIQLKKTFTLKNWVEKAPPLYIENKYIFPVYHCTRGSINRNRNWEHQCSDWRKIALYLKKVTS